MREVMTERPDGANASSECPGCEKAFVSNGLPMGPPPLVPNGIKGHGQGPLSLEEPEPECPLSVLGHQRALRQRSRCHHSPCKSAAAAVGDLSCIERGLVRVFPSAKRSESRFLSQTELSSNEKAVAMVRSRYQTWIKGCPLLL
jgi:hypothetical protein